MNIKSNSKNIRFTIMILSFIAVLGIAFVSIMSYINFKSNFKDIKMQEYTVVTSGAIDDMANAFNFGKKLEQYYGINNIFDDVKSHLGEGFEMAITNPKREIVYSSFDNNFLNDLLLTKKAQIILKNENRNDSYLSTTVNGYNIVAQPIIYNNEDMGNFVLIFDNSVVDKEISNVRLSIVYSIIIAIIVSVLAIIFMVYLILKKGYNDEIKFRKKINISAILSIVTTLILQTIFSVIVYQNSYRQEMQQDAGSILNYINTGIYSVYKQGIPISDISGLKEYLNDRINKIPILWDLRVSKEMAYSSQQSSQNEDSAVLVKKLNGTDIVIQSQISGKYISNTIKEMVLTIISTIVILSIFVLELLKLPSVLEYRRGKDYNSLSSASYFNLTSIIHIVSFFYCAGRYSCMAFSAMTIRQWNEGAFGLGVGISASLPLTVEFFFAMISMLIISKFDAKIGTKRTLWIFSFMIITFNLLTFISSTPEQIIICRCFVGFAYGGIRQVSNDIVANGYDTEKRRSENLSMDNAGMMAGATCGACFGTIISSATEYIYAFLVSVIIFVIYFLISLYIIPWNVIRKESDRISDKKVGFKNVIGMFASSQIVRYIGLTRVPLNFALCLISTLIPGLCQNLNLSGSVLSYCYLVNGLAGIYIGPKLVKYFRYKYGVRASLGGAFILTAISIFILKLPAISVMIMLTSMILGFLDGFGAPLASDEFINLPVVKTKIDESTAMTFNFVISGIVSTCVPLAAEGIMQNSQSGGTNIFVIIGFVYAVIAIFSILTSIGKKRVLK